MELWVGAVAGLLGVIVGGLLQHLTAKQGLDRQHAWESSRIVHEKLELIAEVAEDLGRKMAGFYARAIAAVESGERYQPDAEVLPFPLPRLEMLIDFYAPELRPHLERLIAVRDRMGQTIADVITARGPSEKTERQKVNGLLLKASIEVSSVCEEIAKGASHSARKRLALE